MHLGPCPQSRTLNLASRADLDPAAAARSRTEMRERPDGHALLELGAVERGQKDPAPIRELTVSHVAVRPDLALRANACTAEQVSPGVEHGVRAYLHIHVDVSGGRILHGDAPGHEAHRDSLTQKTLGLRL